MTFAAARDQLLTISEFMATKTGQEAIERGNYIAALTRWMEVIRRDQVFDFVLIHETFNLLNTFYLIFSDIYNQLRCVDPQHQRYPASTFHIPSAQPRQGPLSLLSWVQLPSSISTSTSTSTEWKSDYTLPRPNNKTVSAGIGCSERDKLVRLHDYPLESSITFHRSSFASSKVALYRKDNAPLTEMVRLRWGPHPESEPFFEAFNSAATTVPCKRNSKPLSKSTKV